MYIYQIADGCDGYSWYRGETRLNLKPTLLNYHTEHVLEWQTVADFFVKHPLAHFEGPTTKKLFRSPDPDDKTVTTRKELKFCPAWTKAWADWTGGQGFILVSGGIKQTPFQHIANVHPTSEPLTPNYRNEFTLLQGQLNTLKSRASTASCTCKNFADCMLVLQYQCTVQR